jgi:hypothetical protein
LPDWRRRDLFPASLFYFYPPHLVAGMLTGTECPFSLRSVEAPIYSGLMQKYFGRAKMDDGNIAIGGNPGSGGRRSRDSFIGRTRELNIVGSRRPVQPVINPSGPGGMPYLPGRRLTTSRFAGDLPLGRRPQSAMRRAGAPPRDAWAPSGQAR